MQKRFGRLFRTLELFTFAVTIGTAVPAVAEVSVNINIGPPPVMYAESPEVVVIPHSRVYFVPGLPIDLFFCDGYWWSPRGRLWYRARDYNGPWAVVERHYVPGEVIRIPRDYEELYEREEHIPYGQWEKLWKHREKEEGKEWKEEWREHKKGKRHGHDDED